MGAPGKMRARLALLAYSLIGSVQGIYQDEVGMQEWSLQNVGPPVSVHFAANHRLYVATPAGVAGLGVADGSVVWRHMGTGAVKDLVVVQKVVAIATDTGVRAFKPSTGQYLWESRAEDVEQLISRSGVDELLIVRPSQVQLVGSSGSALVTIKATDVDPDLSFFRAVSVDDKSIGVLCRSATYGTASVLQFDAATGKVTQGPSALSAAPAGVDIWKANSRVVGGAFAVVDGSTVYSTSIANAASWSSLSLKGSGKWSFQGKASGSSIAVTNGQQTSVVRVDSSSGSLSILRSTNSRGALGTVMRDGKIADEVALMDVTSAGKDGAAKVKGALLTSDNAESALIHGDIAINGAPVLAAVAINKGKTKVFVCSSDFSISMLEDEAASTSLRWRRHESWSTVTDAVMWQAPFTKSSGQFAETFQRSSIFSVLLDPMATIATVQELFEDAVTKLSDAADDVKAMILPQSAENDPMSAAKRTKKLFKALGASKLVIAASCSGAVVAMDSVTREVVWEKYFAVAQDKSSSCAAQLLAPTSKFSPKFDLATKHAPLSLFLNPEPTGAISESQAKLVVVDKAAAVVHWIDPATGHVLHDEKLQQGAGKLHKVAPLSKSFAQGTQGVTPVVVTTTDQHMYVLPANSLTPDMASSIDGVHTFEVDAGNSTVVGYVRGSGSAGSKDVPLVPIWNFEFGGEKIVSASQLFHRERDHVPVHVRGDASVLYKFINRNLITVVTERPEAHELILHVIDAVTGRLFHRAAIRGTTPVHVASCDNWVVVHYWAEDSSRYEMSVTEFFESQKDEGPWNIVFGSESRETRGKSAYELEMPVALEQSFIIGPGVSALGVTSTAKGITPRSLVMALNNNQIAVLNKDLISARRPIPEQLAKAIPGEIVKIPAQFVSTADEQIMPYSPVLMIPPTNILSHKEQIIGTRQVISSPTRLESSSLVFSFGLDCFFSVVQTALPYDLLSPGFNFGLLYASLAVVSVSLFATFNLARKKELMDRWA